MADLMALRPNGEFYTMGRGGCKLTELLIAELDREVPRSRARSRRCRPHIDWKPHDKSMIFGYLANMVATMPSWVAMGVNLNELDVAPASGSAMSRQSWRPATHW
jgi:hypothetical protein